MRAESLCDISVVIPAYNAAATLRRCLESVFAQGGEPEVIVVDDGSRDDTYRLLTEEYGGRVTSIRQANAGPAAARNCGIRAARGRYIAFLDADDEWLPDKLSRQFHYLENNPGCGMCFTDMSHWEGGREVHRSYLKERGYRYAAGGRIYDNLLRECFVFTPTVMVRREVLDQVGLFEEKLRIAEDYDLWLRIAERFPVHYLDLPLLRRHRTGNNVTGNLLLYAECSIWLLEQLLERNRAHPGRVEILRRRLAELHRHAGYHEKLAGSPERSRRHYLKSLKYRFTPGALKGFAGSLLRVGGAGRRAGTRPPSTF